MRNKHKAKKLAIRISAMGLAVVMVISLIGTLSLDANAALSLEGIEEIKRDGRMTILEIVPEEHSGSIGYYVGGQEPTANWYNEVGKKAGKEESASERKTYADTLFAKLQSQNLSLMSEGTATAADAYPLTYKGEYVERKPWELGEDTSNVNYTLVRLAEAEEQSVKGSFSGPTQNGDYVKSAAYECVCGDSNKDTAEYIENVATYVFGKDDGAHYYHVDFQQVFLYEHPNDIPAGVDANITFCIPEELDKNPNIAVYTKETINGLPVYKHEVTLTKDGGFRVDSDINKAYGYYIAKPDYTTISEAPEPVIEIKVPTVKEGANAGKVDLEAIAGQTIYEHDSVNNVYKVATFSATDTPDPNKKYYAQDIILPVSDLEQFKDQPRYVVDNITYHLI